MNLALLGPSGAGKGTQAALLCPPAKLRHLSTGDLLRANLAARTALGLLARKYMDRGELVPDEIVAAMIEERLHGLAADQDILLDGFPRTPEQAEALDNLLHDFERRLDAVIYLNVGESEVLWRLRGRLVCRGCHLPYHVEAKPPQTAGVCDGCGDVLQTRPDDDAEIARNRLRVFQRHNEAVLHYYRATSRLYLVDAATSIPTVAAAVTALLGAIQRGDAVAATAEDVLQLRRTPALPRAPTVVAAPTLNFVLLGGPGAGKNTCAGFLKGEFKLQHIATGDLFRENLRNATRLGQFAKSYMDRGELVPDDLTESMVEECLAAVANGGCLLDGFPRTLPQAQALTEMLDKTGRKLTAALALNVPDEILVERLAGRLNCRSCGASYHQKFRQPKQPGRCDLCGGELFQRDDDKLETVWERLRTFHKQTAPVIDYYRRANLLVPIDGVGDLALVRLRTAAAVQRALAGRLPIEG